MRTLLSTSNEQLRVVCVQLREYAHLSKARRIKKLFRLLCFLGLIASGSLAWNLGRRMYETLHEPLHETRFPSDFLSPTPPEPLVIGRDYLELLQKGGQVQVGYCGTVPSKSQLPRESNTSIGDEYIATDTGQAWAWTIPPGHYAEDPSWLELAGPLGTMPEGRVRPGRCYLAALPDKRGGVMRYSGAVNSRAELSSTGNRLGDSYLDIQSGNFWIWTMPIGATSPRWIDP